MRRYMRALMLCMVFAVFSGLYVYSRLFYSDVSARRNGAKKTLIPLRASGARRGVTDKNAHSYNCKTSAFISVFQLESWPGFIRYRFSYRVYSIRFPNENAAEWKKLFKPCASQRLFLPLILEDVDSIVYVDSDILFLQPVDLLWRFLSDFNSSQLAAMAPEHEEPRIAWYNRFARHPFYGRTGINSGVMLMNLTRMRSMFFKNDMTSTHTKLLIHKSLLEFSCQWNYRPDHCIYGSNCASAEEDGIYILHGNRGVYHDYKQPAFRAVYEAIKKYTFGTDPVTSLLEPLEEELLKTTHTYCGKSHTLFTKRLGNSVAKINRKTREW
uniref:Glucoside xylosyltransferase 1 n=1 Tax=Neolamprologus brichardi TaxID=32507 RepID=A0A3Q4G0M5_NEOBR